MKIGDKVLVAGKTHKDQTQWLNGTVYEIEYSDDPSSTIYHCMVDNAGVSQRMRGYREGIRTLMTDSDIDELVDL